MTEPAPPILSLVVPVYGVEDYVGECLDSIIAAPGFAEHCELVVVDDGSPDGSMTIVRQRCAGLANVTILEQANAGLGAARNSGLARARGRYIWFVDSDDEICRDAIMTLVRCIEQHASDIIAFEFETTGGTLKRAPYLATYDRPVDPIDFMVSGRPPSPVQFYAFARAMLETAGLTFQPAIYHEDALFTPLAMTSGRSLVRLHNTAYRYRLRPGSIMSCGRADKHLADMLSIAEMLAAHAMVHPPSSRARRALGREIGFAMAGIRYYAVRSTVDARRRLAPVPRLSKLGRHWWRCFSWGILVRYVRLLAFLMSDRLRVKG